MSDLDALRARIAGYADYGDEPARQQVDKQIRAYLGEALAAARDRLRPAGPLAEQIDGLLLRCEFSDQRAIRAASHARYERTVLDRLHRLDRELAEAADRLRTVSAPGLGPALDDAARLLDERLGALAEAPTA
ncbi:MAG: hypothetical protein QOI11_865 [Candidatus Eremiobacteraeota bacterium]|jgi:hypothetical protein|nr:hypothetical protein [Candidatus Eremiobacteraeota bacterium]